MKNSAFTAHAVRVLAVLALLLLGGTFAPRAQAEDCGAEGQRACTVPERVPSCDIDLVEQAGRCVRLRDCGGDGQRICLPIERMVFDPRTAPPPGLDALTLRHQPCNLNHVKAGPAMCSRPRCGREGEAACPFTVRIRSCDYNLREKNNRCERPACGRVGEPECPVWERPNLSGCDVNLISDAGTCRRPGTRVVATSSAPPPPPSGTAPAPPPPPTGTAVTAVAPTVSSTYLPPVMAQPVQPPPPAGAVGTAPPATGGWGTPGAPVSGGGGAAFEPGVDRLGGDLLGFPLAADDPTLCQTTCAINAQCAAWTYTRPGVKGPQAMCYVKGVVPVPRQDPCCVSGVRMAGSAVASAGTPATGAPATASVTSPADAGLRDPQRFPRVPGMVRQEFSASGGGAQTTERATYSSTLPPQDLHQQLVARLQAEGWRRGSSSESGNSPNNVLIMSGWRQGTMELDLRLYGRGVGATDVLAVMTIR